jgi:hypothetical protein
MEDFYGYDGGASFAASFGGRSWTVSAERNLPVAASEAARSKSANIVKKCG